MLEKIKVPYKRKINLFYEKDKKKKWREINNLKMKKISGKIHSIYLIMEKTNFIIIS